MKDVVRMLAATTGVSGTPDCDGPADGRLRRRIPVGRRPGTFPLLPLQYDGLNVDLPTADGKVSSP